MLGVLGLPDIISETAPQLLSTLSPYMGAALLVGAGSYAGEQWVRPRLAGERLHQTMELCKDIYRRLMLTKRKSKTREELNEMAGFPYMWEQLKARLNELDVPTPPHHPSDRFVFISLRTVWLAELIGCVETKDIKRARGLLAEINADAERGGNS